MQDMTTMQRAAVLGGLFSCLAAVASAEPYAYTIVDAAGVPAPLGGIAGDAARGEVAFAEHCADCHAAAALAGGEVASLRLAIIDLSVMQASVADHAFYDPDAEGRTRLSARMVEDILRHLSALD
jgi:hypothetical protein